MQYQKIKNIKYYVYDNEQEFRVHHPDAPIVSNWKDGQEGDWVISDDNRIVQLLKVSNRIQHPNDRKNYTLNKGWVRTVVGTFLNNPKSKMDTDFDKHPNRYTFSTKIKNTNKRVKERETCTSKEKEFVTNVVVGKTAVESYMEAFNETNKTNAKKKAVVLLKQRRIMSEIEKGVGDIAKELGIDHEFILSRLKYLAERSEDENISLQSLKELGKAIGTIGGQVKKIETGVLGMFQGFQPEHLTSAKRPEITDGKE